VDVRRLSFGRCQPLWVATARPSGTSAVSAHGEGQPTHTGRSQRPTNNTTLASSRYAAMASDLQGEGRLMTLL